MTFNVDNPGAVIGVTGDEATDVLVVRSGEMRPDITQPTIIGAVVRIPPGFELAEGITLAGTVLPDGTEYTETMRVVAVDADGLEAVDNAV